ncbi:hypothetical protein E4T56_gene21026 [Termitomyces sp. T112]|nr:hypothetical protein E4T56_gene21026 [Termitomyces sp. T112]
MTGICAGLEFFTQLECDGIVAIGGSSPVDASKAILYFQQKETSGQTLLQIAIPTTLSATEYSISAGYTDNEGNKVAVSSQSLAPAGIILDAELTLATPDRLWLLTGIHSLDHVCLTLAPTVALQTKIASQDHKELLAKTIFYLQQPLTSSSAATLPTGPLQEALNTLTLIALTIPLIGDEHVHAVDPNAVSVITKEWLYWATKVVADKEKSPVLLANTIHHRSDTYSSLVAFFAIIGTWLFPALPLDPFGGLLVSFIILRQGLDLLSGQPGPSNQHVVQRGNVTTTLVTDQKKRSFPGATDLGEGLGLC